MKSVVEKSGQVVIPKSLRTRLGIGPKTVLDFRADKGRLIVTKVPARDPVARVTGCIRLAGGTDVFMRELRGAP